jgi:hypothetical protein
LAISFSSISLSLSYFLKSEASAYAFAASKRASSSSCDTCTPSIALHLDAVLRAAIAESSKVRLN